MFVPVATLDDAADDGLWSVAWGPRGLVAGASDELVRSFQHANGRIDPLRQFKGHELAITSVSVSADGKVAASTSLESKIRIWDVDAGTEIRAIDAGPTEAFTASLSADGAFVASGSQGGFVNLWSVTNGRRTARMPSGSGKFTMSVAFSPTGKLVAAGAADGAVHLFDVATAQRLVQSFETHTASVRALAFSPDGSMLVSGADDARLALYELRDTQATLAASLDGHTSWVLDAAFAPDGSCIASCGADRSVRLWDTATRQPTQVIANAHSDQCWGVAFDPLSGGDASRLRLASVGDDRAIHVYEAQPPVDDAEVE